MLDELDRFVYRSYLDFDTLRQLRAMKHQIEAELRSPDLIERNIKLGHGGIRELEFIVQALTLIYGGRDPRIRTEKTIEALDRLADFGYLPAARAHKLAEAYLFLRNVEHKLQVVSGLQTHTLPRNDAGHAPAGGYGCGWAKATRRWRGCARRCTSIASWPRISSARRSPAARRKA